METLSGVPTAFRSEPAINLCTHNSIRHLNRATNGRSLEVIRASHRGGLLPSVDDPFGHRIADGQVDETDFSPVTVRRGDVIFFSGFLVHRTGSAGGGRVRIALSYRYNNAAEPSFVARNYPSPYVYRPDMRLLDDNFPTADDIRQLFTD